MEQMFFIGVLDKKISKLELKIVALQEVIISLEYAKKRLIEINQNT